MRERKEAQHLVPGHEYRYPNEDWSTVHDVLPAENGFVCIHGSNGLRNLEVDQRVDSRESR